MLAWRLSNTLEASFCVAALREALEGYGPPEIFNSDQGSPCTSVDFTIDPQRPALHRDGVGHAPVGRLGTAVDAETLVGTACQGTQHRTPRLAQSITANGNRKLHTFGN